MFQQAGSVLFFRNVPKTKSCLKSINLNYFTHLFSVIVMEFNIIRTVGLRPPRLKVCELSMQ